MGFRRDVERGQPDGHAGAERKNGKAEEAHRGGIGSRDRCPAGYVTARER